jgi:DNA repair protein RecO (recombination protein O)
MQIKTDGVVLSDHKIEDDRILTLLTRDHGVMTAFANGANRVKTRLSASTELLCYSQFVLFSSRGRHVVDAADSIRIFFGLRKDLEKLSLASYLAELAKELAPQKQEASQELSLLLNSLSFIDEGKRDLALLKAIFELRLLTLAGYMPDLVACRGCSEFEKEDMRFLALSGELVCGDCATEEEKRTGAAVSPGALAAMRHIIYAPPERLFAFTLSPKGTGLLAGVSERYLLAMLEKMPATLAFYKSLAKGFM